jgi:hypothetical protein
MILLLLLMLLLSNVELILQLSFSPLVPLLLRMMKTKAKRRRENHLVTRKLLKHLIFPQFQKIYQREFLFWDLSGLKQVVEEWGHL